MTQIDKQFMEMAIALARSNASSQSGGPFGAVIVRNGQLLSSGSNSVTIDNDPTAHAEVNAIREACRKIESFDLSGCVLYTSCEPCPMCLSACYWAHIDKIFYAANREDAAKAGFDDDFIYRELPLPMDKRSVKCERILDLQGLVPFEMWIKNEKKVSY